MERKNFVSLIVGAVGGTLFGIGMCICLLPEWSAFRQGVLASAADAAVLLATLSVCRKMKGKLAMQLNVKAVGPVVLGIASTPVLGSGMCLTMAWDMLAPGTVIGIVGIVLLLRLIPICKGLE